MPTTPKVLASMALLLLINVSGARAWANDTVANVDPWEPLNRRIFAFNEGLDEYFLRPVAKGYRYITPDPVERSVTNFLANLYDFNTVVNSILQGRGGDALHSSGRFVVNSTIGVAGLFDVATHLGVEPRPADFGQTLAVWGVDQGPFLMVPVLGPRTLRSGIGQLFDTYTSIPFALNDSAVSWGVFGAVAIDVRAQLTKADDLLTGDRYIFTRNAYLQRRASFVSDGEVSDSFSDFEEENFEEF